MYDNACCPLIVGTYFLFLNLTGQYVPAPFKLLKIFSGSRFTARIHVMIQVELFLCCYRSLESPKNRVRDHLSLIRGCIPVQLSMDELLVLARHFEAIVSTMVLFRF